MGTYSITEAMVSWLTDLGYEASTYPPADAPGSPDRFVTVERVGGAVRDIVDHPSMAVQAWAPTDAEAEAMANAIRAEALAGALPEGIHSIRVESGPYRFFDPSTRSPRYQLTLRITSQLTT